MTDEQAFLFALLLTYAAFMTVQYIKAKMLLKDRANIISRLVQDEEYCKGVRAQWQAAVETMQKGGN
jgi:hypothetical protein